MHAILVNADAQYPLKVFFYTASWRECSVYTAPCRVSSTEVCICIVHGVQY